MRKRSRKRQSKRSGQDRGGQSRQKLSKKARELYRPESSRGEEDSAWHAALEEGLDPSPTDPGRSRSGPPSRDCEATAAATTTPSPPIAEKHGRVISITSGACRVESAGEPFDCVLSSDIARDQQAAVAVGDEITFAAHGDSAFRLHRVLPRRTTLSRPDPRNPRRERVIAANIDVAVHVTSVIRPPLRLALVDRYMIAIGRGGAKAAVCVNKIDLLPDGEARAQHLECLLAYRELGVDIVPCSAKTGEGLDRLRALLAGRIAVLVGHSGVGKSALLNALSPGLEAATGRVSEGFGKGRHTTTRSNLYRLEGDICIIDTPGIRELGLQELTGEELRAYFPDLERHAASCRFANCGHSHEPDCGVRDAVAAGDVSRPRHETYLRILESMRESRP